MVITKGKVVTLEYVMRDPFGKEIENSEELGPLDYLHGFGNMLPGVEKKLEGAQEGDELQVIVQPEDGYGKMDDSLIETFPIDTFNFEDLPEVGMEIVLDADGEEMPAVIEHIGDTEITLNANHPMAGIVLHFDIKVVKIREATVEELEHGEAVVLEGHQH